MSPVGTIQLLPGEHDLSESPTLNFFPASTTIGELTIRGTRNVAESNLLFTAIGSHGPNSIWLSVTVDATLPASTYNRFFATFDEGDVPFIILDNTATTVDFVGTSFEVFQGFDPVVGNTFCVYTLESSIIWNPSQQVDLKIGNHTDITFKDITIDAKGGAEWVNPNSRTPLIFYQTCDMTTSSTFGGAYRNSMHMLACLGRGTVVNPRFLAPGSNQCVHLERSYIATVAFQVPISCAIEWSYFEDLAFGIEIDTGDFQFFSCWINGNDSIAGFRVQAGSNGFITFSLIQNCVDYGVSADAATTFWISDSTIEDSTSDGLRVEKGATVRARRVVINRSGGNAVTVLNGSRVALQDMSGTDNTGHAVVIREASTGSFINCTALTGMAGDVEVGLAGTKTWAAVIAGAPADTSDSTLNPTENVFVYAR